MKSGKYFLMSCWEFGDLYTLVFELALLQRGRLLLPFMALLEWRVKISQGCRQGRGEGKSRV